MGESELVLDRLTVDEVLRIVGAQGKRGTPPVREPADDTDWRKTLRDVDAGIASTRERLPSENAPRAIASPPPPHSPKPSSSKPSSPSIPSIPSIPSTPSTTRLSDLAPTGLVVGGREAELFGGPISQAASLADVAEMVRTCTRCPLYATATNPVPGEGSSTARLMCIGE